MPTGYVKKLAKKHGVSTATAEKHWEMAKAAAAKEGHGEDYGYVTAIYKNMMHENCFIPTLKDLTQGMTFKYFLVAEADAEQAPTKERSPEYKHLEDRFPQFGELPLRARNEIMREIKADDLLSDYDMLPQEEKDSIDAYLHDLVIDKMQAVVGQGANFKDWQKDDEEYARRRAEHDAEQADVDDAAAALAGDDEQPGAVADEMPEKKKRASAGPRHIAAMRQQHIPTQQAAFAPAGSDEVGAPVKSYYRKWSDMNPEQRAKASAHAKKHGTMYRVKNAKWFRAMPPAQQEAMLSVLRSGGSVADARQAAGL